jgi:hypothetical protein
LPRSNINSMRLTKGQFSDIIDECMYIIFEK